ncbi:ankyrin repeat domain-containing protein [Wolbachia endosymbiont of Cardiocondyla obscurior]|uniref:ankyrin repeat domain-containing protein n=1 Tax=Wolbachia endosymbiont of Cardiocondyla obscurior TaxID=2687307 RepID=UPI00157A6AAA|nr:ankyrin repeat domain-containing protein [Wolbachia endosymbiont of Cardiocondyla obscurior]
MITNEAKRVRDNTKETRTVIHTAASHGDLEIVRFFIEKAGYDINLRDEDGCTLLFYAAVGGCLEVVRYLIKKGADINATAKTGATALHIAARVGHLEVIKCLVEEGGADKNAVDNNGYGVLDYNRGYDLLTAKATLFDKPNDAGSRVIDYNELNNEPNDNTKH